MPTMGEIYAGFAPEYDELVRHEDFRGNLWTALSEHAAWEGASVIEAGCGTGRVTRMYIGFVKRAACFDRSEHMIRFAERALAASPDRIEFAVAENEELPPRNDEFDIFIEGWSFGHSAVAASTATVETVTARLVENATKNVRSGGTVFLLETLGTNVDEPYVPHAKLELFYRFLESDHGFSRHEIRTDYRFDTIDDAVRIMGFFFGEEMAQSVRMRDATVIPEWTGLWARST